LVVVPVNPRGNLVRSIWVRAEPGGATIFGSLARKWLQRAEIPGDSGWELFFSAVWQAPPKTARGAAAEALPNGPEVNRRNNIALKKNTNWFVHKKRNNRENKRCPT
jgi:hypothetical protein